MLLYLYILALVIYPVIILWPWLEKVTASGFSCYIITLPSSLLKKKKKKNKPLLSIHTRAHTIRLAITHIHMHGTST